MASAVFTTFNQILDSNGDPVSGALIYIYDAGTTTPRALYSDAGLSVSVSNPIVANAAGRTTTDGGTTVGSVYTSAGSYKAVIKTSAGVTLLTLDNIDTGVPIGSGALAIANGGTGATTAGAALTALGGADAATVADLASDVAALVGAGASTEKTHIATGTTAQRPATPVEGDVRRNTTLGTWEGYNGSAAWENFVVIPTGQTDPSATDTAEGLIELAVQSEMETGTDVVRAVTPGRQHYHPSASKCWLKCNNSGTISVSYNITSIADTGTGVVTVTVATDFSSANYVVVVSDDTTGNDVKVTDLAAGSFVIRAFAGLGASDSTTYHAVAFGDQ